MAEKYAVLIKYKYLEYIDSAKLSDADAWTFLKSIIEYDKTGTEPIYSNPVLSGLFAVVKIDLDKNKENYDVVSQERSKAGKEGAKKRWENSKNSKSQDDMANMAKIHDHDHEFDTDLEKEKEDQNSSGFAENDCETDPEKVFIHIWQTNPDIFNFMARIESPKEWAAFWEKHPYPPDDIKRRMQNFINGVKSGAILRKYVPRTPDRFVLKGHLNTSDAPYTKNREGGGVSPPSSLKGKKSLGGLDSW